MAPAVRGDNPKVPCEDGYVIVEVVRRSSHSAVEEQKGGADAENVHIDGDAVGRDVLAGR